jgi:hypothetical protein
VRGFVCIKSANRVDNIKPAGLDILDNSASRLCLTSRQQLLLAGFPSTQPGATAMQHQADSLDKYGWHYLILWIMVALASLAACFW